MSSSNGPLRWRGETSPAEGRRALERGISSQARPRGPRNAPIPCIRRSTGLADLHSPHASTDSRRLRTRLLSLLLAAGLVTRSHRQAGPASAALPKTPTALSPSGIAVNANPILLVEREPKAESYDRRGVEHPDFSDPLPGHHHQPACDAHQPAPDDPDLLASPIAQRHRHQHPGQRHLQPHPAGRPGPDVPRRRRDAAPADSRRSSSGTADGCDQVHRRGRPRSSPDWVDSASYDTRSRRSSCPTRRRTASTPGGCGQCSVTARAPSTPRRGPTSSASSPRSPTRLPTTARTSRRSSSTGTPSPAPCRTTFA